MEYNNEMRLVGGVHLRRTYRRYVERLTGGGRVAPDDFLDFAAFRLRMAGADWVRTFSWDAWCTPTCERDVSERRVRLFVMRWLRRQGRQAFAAVIYERTPGALLVHPHALVGGLHRTSPKHPTPLAVTHLRESWRHGIITVEPYHAGMDRPGTTRGASWYVTKTGVDAVTIVGQPVRYRPRR